MNIFESTNELLKNNQHLSGWAQFLGAMIAIWITARVALAPIEAERAARDSDRRAFLIVVRDATMMAFEAVDPICRAKDQNPSDKDLIWQACHRYEPQRLQALKKALEVPIGQWPNAALYAKAAEMPSTIDAYRTTILALSAEMGNAPGFRSYTSTDSEAVDRMDAETAMLRKEYQSLLQMIGDLVARLR